MGLGRHLPRRLHTTAAVADDGADFAPIGTRVIVREGFKGVVTEVNPGPGPGADTYYITLDAGMGGGEYGGGEFRLDPDFTITAKTALHPADCSACGGTGTQPGDYECYICDGTGSAAAEREGRALGEDNSNPENGLPVGVDLAQTAANDYPELAGILVERPPLEHAVGLTMKASKISESSDACPGSGAQPMEWGGYPEHWTVDTPGDEMIHINDRTGVGVCPTCHQIESTNADGSLRKHRLDLQVAAARFVVVDQTGAVQAGPFPNSDLARQAIEMNVEPTGLSITVAPDYQFQQSFASLHEAATRTYTIVGPIGEASRSDWELHIKGCGDLQQPKYQRYRSSMNDITADSWQDAADQWIDEELQEMGYSVGEHVRVLPCAKKGVPAEAPVAKPVDPTICPGSGQDFGEGVYSGGGRRMFFGCPVCGQSVGTGSGRVPRHKKKAEFLKGEKSVGEWPNDKIEKHLARRDRQALCGAGDLSYLNDFKGKIVRGLCEKCIEIWGQATAPTAGLIDKMVDNFAERTHFTPYNNYSFDWCRFRKNERCMFPLHLDEEGTREAGYTVWVPEDRGYCPRHSWEAQEACPAPSEPGPKTGLPNAKPDATVPWSAGGQRPIASVGVEITAAQTVDYKGVKIKVKKGKEWGYTAVQINGHGWFQRMERDEERVLQNVRLTIDEAQAHPEDYEDFYQPGHKGTSDPSSWQGHRCAARADGGTVIFPAEPVAEQGMACAYCMGLGSGGVIAVEREGGVCGKCMGRGYNDARFVTGSANHDDHEWALHFHSSWKDVQSKATRIRNEGHVRVVSATGGYITSEVRGDSNIYQCTIMRAPGSKAAAMWECGCAWSNYSWARSGRWKKYEGRMCSHALATLYEAQAREMFGQTISEDRGQPQWRSDSTLPVVRPGDSRTKPNAWRVGSMGDGETAHAVSTDPSLAQSLGQAIAISMTGGFRGDLKALVRGVMRRVLDVLPGGKALVDGLGEVPATDVIHPHYHPTRGLDYHEPRTSAKAAAKYEKCFDGYNITTKHGDTFMARKTSEPLNGVRGPWWTLVASDARFQVQQRSQEHPDHFASLADLKQRVYEYEGDADNEFIGSLHFMAASATEANMNGAMVALVPPESVLQALAIPGGEPIENMHFTVAYLGDKADLDLDRLEQAVNAFAMGAQPLAGRIGGYGVFCNDDAQVIVALGDFPGLAEWRNRLLEYLSDAGFVLPGDHDFTPHMTLQYVTDGDATVPTALPEAASDVSFDSFALVYGPEWTFYEMGEHEPITSEDRSQKAAANQMCPNCSHLVMRHGTLGHCFECECKTFTKQAEMLTDWAPHVEYGDAADGTGEGTVIWVDQQGNVHGADVGDVLMAPWFGYEHVDHFDEANLFEADAHDTPSWPKGEAGPAWDGTVEDHHSADTPEGGEHIGPKDECPLCTSKTAAAEPGEWQTLATPVRARMRSDLPEWMGDGEYPGDDQIPSGSEGIVQGWTLGNTVPTFDRGKVKNGDHFLVEFPEGTVIVSEDQIELLDAIPRRKASLQDRVLYHATTVENVPGILANGIHIREEITYDPVNFAWLTPDRSRAVSYLNQVVRDQKGSGGAIITVRIPDGVDPHVGDWDSEDDMGFLQDVPAEWIVKHEIVASKVATNDEARDWDMDPALRDDESWLFDAYPTIVNEATGQPWTTDEVRAVAQEALAPGTPERIRWDEEHDYSVTAALHDEPEPALPTTDGAEDEDPNEGLHEDDPDYEPEASDFLAASRGIRDQGPYEVHTTAAQGAPGVPADVQLPAWLGGAGDSGASRVAQSRAANSEIAAMAKQFLVHGAKVFTQMEQQAIINEGEDQRAANLDRLDLTGTHYGPIAEAIADIEVTEEDWLL